MAARDIDNPLRIPILRLLREHPQGISEYDLIRALEKDAGFPTLSEEPQLALFQKHFLVMNALYRLHDSLWADERLVLVISPLHIALETGPAGFEGDARVECRDRATAGAAAHAATAATATGNPVTTADSAAVDARETHAALRDYYLDWNQWTQTSSDDVAALLAGFWRRFSEGEPGGRRARALAVLELAADADWSAIRRRYRELAGRHHPDRGGDSARFLAVREAYEVLRIHTQA